MDVRERRNPAWGFVLAALGPRLVGRGLAAMVLWVVMFIAARFVLELPSFAPSVRLAIALAPLPAFAWLLWELVRKAAEEDELERRIQHEALAVAFALTLLLMIGLGMVQLAIPLSIDDWSYRHLWPYLFLFYLVGLTRARRRYQ